VIYYKNQPLMRVPRGNARALEGIYKAGGAPRPEHLVAHTTRTGEWGVTMLTGPAPNMGGQLLRHRKQFARMGEDLVGCNLMLGGLRWGWFRFREIETLTGTELLLDYDVVENSWLTRRLVDRIRKTSDPDVLLGKCYVRWFNLLRFVGHFTLTRLK
jgi:hypothetical protein